ncbi:MAG TPA: hypothetical protein GXZ31_02585 [Thermoanaerobacterales bacterium]|nr:hypothetical protein [Thermoanaerobacterales bacterium]
MVTILLLPWEVDIGSRMFQLADSENLRSLARVVCNAAHSSMTAPTTKWALQISCEYFGTVTNLVIL